MTLTFNLITLFPLNMTQCKHLRIGLRSPLFHGRAVCGSSEVEASKVCRMKIVETITYNNADRAKETECRITGLEDCEEQ